MAGGGASSSQQAGVGMGTDDAKRQLAGGGGCPRIINVASSDNWQVRGLSGRPVLLKMGSYQPVTFYQWQGGGVVGHDAADERSLRHRDPDRGQGAGGPSAVNRQEWSGQHTHRQSATEVSGAPGQWLTVGGAFHNPRQAGRPDRQSIRHGRGQRQRTPDSADPGHAPVSQPVSGADPGCSPAAGWL